MLAKYLARFEETGICIFFVRQLCFPGQEKTSFSDLTNTGTQHAANMSMRGVSRMQKTPPGYQRQVITRLNHTQIR